MRGPAVGWGARALEPASNTPRAAAPAMSRADALTIRERLEAALTTPCPARDASAPKARWRRFNTSIAPHVESYAYSNGYWRVIGARARPVTLLSPPATNHRPLAMYTGDATHGV